MTRVVNNGAACAHRSSRRVLFCFVIVAASLRPPQLEAQYPAQSAAPALTLQQVLTEATTSHPLVGAADARARAARGNRSTAGALPNPLLGYMVENAPLSNRSRLEMERENMTTATLPLQSLYQRWPDVRRASAAVNAADAEAVMTRQQMALSGARSFYRTALLQERVAAARDLVAWLDSIVAYNRLRTKEGVTAEADLIRSQLERDRMAAEESMLAAEFARARTELGTFLSGDIPARVAIDTQPLAVSLETAPDRVAQRPDVRAAREHAAEARAGIAVERSLIIPELDATIGIKQSAGTTSLIAGASLPVPLFNQNRGAIARANAEHTAATLELAAVERSARAELQGAQEAARTLIARVTELSTGFLARAEESRRIALGAYREGAVPLIQVLDAARAWSDARASYHEILFAQHQSVLELLVARGETLPAALGLNR